MISLTAIPVPLIDSGPDGDRTLRAEGESLTAVVVPREKLADAGQALDDVYRNKE